MNGGNCTSTGCDCSGIPFVGSLCQFPSSNFVSISNPKVCVQDASVNSFSYELNNDQTTAIIGYDGTSDNIQLLRFDLLDLPYSILDTQVLLHQYVETTVVSVPVFLVIGITTNDWSEAQTTWDNAQGSSEIAVSVQIPANFSGWLKADISSLFYSSTLQSIVNLRQELGGPALRTKYISVMTRHTELMPYLTVNFGNKYSPSSFAFFFSFFSLQG
jgi:hypothetical protein